MSEQDQQHVAVTLPDGSTLEKRAGSTVADVAREIGPGLAADAVAGKLDGELVDLATPIEDDVSLEIVTDDSDDYRRVLCHTAAHVFAQALQRLHPDAKLAIGPPTDEGFYYDVAGVELDEDDLDEIKAEMEAIIDADYDLKRVERSRDEAFAIYEDNAYKRDILETEAAGEDPVSFYVQDDWQDLCQGPHVGSTGEIGGITLLNISSAYWRGDETQDTLTRVYGTAFSSQSELDAYLERREEAKKRDHRRLGQSLNLFSVPEHSPGCVHFHPPGMTIRRELEDYIRSKNETLGYEEVWTPELNKAELWKRSGHYDKFTAAGEMFVWEQDETEYGLKPMNCANHAYIYAQDQRSYRDLPIRYSEFGTCYRNEQSGELSGLLRVRGFTQDDGHAFLRPDQIQTEITNAIRVIEDIYTDFDLDVHFVLETRGDDAIGSEDLWEQATAALRDALEAEGIDYATDQGEAAFYGPKIGANAEDVLGREWTIGTVQLDFNIPERLGLTYTGEDNEEHQPVMIHRALLGTFERFMGVMIEHYNGKFPLWLAPEQVRILPITERHLEYATEVKEALTDFRVSIETRDWTIGRKIAEGHEDNLPYMLIVGDDEVDTETIAVRDRQEREAQNITIPEFRDHLHDERAEKRRSPDFLD